MVGTAMKRILPDANYPDRQKFYYMTRRKPFFNEFANKSVIHLAAKVGGIKANTNELADFYVENSVLNEKLLFAANQGGAKKVVSLLSTCIYPDGPYVTYPLTEGQLHMGPPHHSNFGYAYAKKNG